MIYSQWNPASGKYSYYEGPDVQTLNDDLPKPQLPKASSPIGVPAISCGRPLPIGVRFVGTGLLARGVIALPAKVAVSGQLMGGDVAARAIHLQHIALGMVLGAAITWLGLRWRKRK